MESASIDHHLGRYSFLAIDPFDVVKVPRPKKDALAQLAIALDRYATPTIPDLPPFQGGAAGVLSFELGKCFERLPTARHDEFGIPLVVLGLYDVVLAWDHRTKKAWIVSQGLPEREEAARSDRAQRRMQEIMNGLRLSERAICYSSDPSFQSQVGPHATAHGLTAPQFETRLGGAWIGNFDSNGFQSAVQRARDYIFAGDIFQVNLAQRLMKRAECDPLTLYERLRVVNAAPFAGFFDMGDACVVSSSPERFLSVRSRKVETRPIKGTRRRSDDPIEDVRIAQELLASAKDRSENTMIVDLLRNDLSRVCKASSVQVQNLCGLESYRYVHHLVSVVEGELRDDASLTDLIASTFPGGSITGAPKVRAMEIIAELEPTARGPYCGCLGYFGFDGSMDTNILIRSVTCSRGWWQIQVGGGIVADSDPALEEEETWTKAIGMVKAMVD